MSTCPFCSADIDESLDRFGGNCPHCFNVIPGEEAPTDPGISVPETAPAPATGSNKTLYVFGFLALVAVGVIFGGMGKNNTGADSASSGSEALVVANQGEETEAVDPQEKGANGGLESEEEALADAIEAPTLEKEGSETKRSEQPAPSKAKASPPKEKTKTPEPKPKPKAKDVESSTLQEDDLFSIPLPSANMGMVLETPASINSAVRRYTKKKKGQLTQCYNQQLNVDPTLKGRWIVRFAIQQDGSTSSVSVKHMDQRSREFEDCIKRAVEGWKFPAIAEDWNVEKEYSFRP